jgi:ABC-type polysaccharide/polyol phosphate transport system ATPase subunit
MADIEFHGVHKRYRVYRERYQSLKEVLLRRKTGDWEDRWALRDVSFDVEPGSILGLIGANGAGKSTSLKLIARILVPDRGEVVVRRPVAGLLELGAGFQPEYTGRENIHLNASILGLTNRQIQERFDEIVAFSELEDHIDSALSTYSSGMQMRLGFSIAAHVGAEILLIDEVLAVGDEHFQRKCLAWLDAFHRDGGTIVLVSHDLAVVRERCDRVALIEDGRLAEMGHPNEVIRAYLDRLVDVDRAVIGRRDPQFVDGRIRLVELGEVRFLDATGQPREAFETGDPMVVEVDYRVNRPLPEPVFSLAILGSDGRTVYATSTAADGVLLDPLEGDGMIRLEYPSLQLLPGAYAVEISVAAEPSMSTLIDSTGAGLGFRVASGTKEYGVVRLDHRWKHGADDGAPRPAAAGRRRSDGPARRR